MTYYTAPGIPLTQRDSDKPRNWENIPQDVINVYQSETEQLMSQQLSIAETKAKEAALYNKLFADFGFKKPTMN